MKKLYRVRITVRGYGEVLVPAETEEQARGKAENIDPRLIQWDSSEDGTDLLIIAHRIKEE